MRVYAEAAFDILYLFVVLIMGIFMVLNAPKGSVKRLFGVMAIVLGAGDAFHLVPRVIELLNTGEVLNTPAIGLGKLITSISMTVFYVMLYEIWARYFRKGSKGLRLSIYLLAALRIALCALPQNQWFVAQPPLICGIVRNIPFLAMGAIIIALFFTAARGDKYLRFMWLAVALSFAFYIPVVLWAHINPLIGMLMIPKTICYVWVVTMGFSKGFASAS